MSQLSSSRERALAFVDRHRDALLAFAGRLVETPSDNPPGDERRVAQIAQEHLGTLGFGDVRSVGPRPQRANLICRYTTGRPGPTLLLNGHLDTKPPGSRAAWQTDPFEAVIKDGRLYGLGAADMKGPDAALVYGLAAATSAAGEELCGQVLLVLSADEEGQADEGARYLVQELGLRADAALIAEPCGVREPWETLPLISRGFCGLRFTVEGTQTHSSIGDRLPVVNASLAASRLLLFLDEHLRPAHPATPLCPLGPTVNLGATLSGGQALAIVPGHAQFTVDIRTLPGMSRTQVAADIDRTLAAFHTLHPRVGVSWEFVAGTMAWTEPTEISPEMPLVTMVQNAAQQVLGRRPPLGYFPGGTDAIWWQGVARIPTIPGFGPGLLPNCHRPNEWIALEEIVQAAKIYALTILEYFAP